MAKIDLKDAYYSVSISWIFQKFLKFKWKDKLYRLTCFSNSTGSCPRTFTKLNKMLTVTLRFENLPLGGCIEKFLTKGDTSLICKENAQNSWFVWNVGFGHKF